MGGGLQEKKSQSHESQEFIETKNKPQYDSWQGGLKKSYEDPLVFQHSESFTQSREICSKLVNPKGEIKQLLSTNDDDKKGKVLYCQECNYQTPNLNASKSKQKLNAHVFSRHNKEDLA